MADPADSAPEPVEGEVLPAADEQVAEVRHLPVPADGPATELTRPLPASLPATVIAATGGFVLGAAAFVLMRILRRPGAGRRLARRRRKMISKQRGVDVEASRSFRVDVHLLKR